MSLKLLSLPQWSLTGALLIGAVALLRLLLHRQSRLPKSVWPLLWWLVVLRLLLPFSLPCPGSVQNLWLPAEPPPSAAPPDIPYYYITYPLDGYSTDDYPADNYAEQTAAAAEPSRSLPVGLLVWALGAGTSAAFFALAYMRSRRLFQQASAPDWPFSFFIQQWLGAHRLPLRRISVRQTPAIDTPLTYGLLRPVILMPSSVFADSALELPQQQELHYALLHEWTHIRHFDAAAKLLAAAALCLHWFNPAVWLFFWLFSRDLELACDASVVRRCGNTAEARRGYALALLNWTEKQQPSPLYSHFGLKPEKDVITERIVAIMKMKKVSVFGTCAAALLLACVGLAFATNPAPREAAVGQEANTDISNYIDVNNDAAIELDVAAADYANLTDAELHRLFSEQQRANLAQLLAPYEPFGLSWSFDDPDMDGQGLKMYYHGREVRGIYDEPSGNWLTENIGDGNFAPDAVELYTVYSDGQLSGLRFADAAEQREWDELRHKPLLRNIKEYAPFGLSVNYANRLVYQGKLVRYFWDGYEVYDADGTLVGRALHYEYTNLYNGEIDLRTRRDVIYHDDGSANQFGPLLGLEVYTEPNIDAVSQPPTHQVTTATYSGADNLNLINGQTIGEILDEYAPYGLAYRETIMSDGTHRDIYFNGELVAAFVDRNPNGSSFSTKSTSKPSGEENVVLTEYDEQGQLAGLRLATREEADEYLDHFHTSKYPGFYSGYDENGEATLYVTTDGGRTRRAIAKPE